MLPGQMGVFQGIVVVPEVSARELLNVETADHFSITKPAKKTSRRFNVLTQLLHNIVSNAKEETCPKNHQYVPKHIIGINFPLQEVKELLKHVTCLCLTGMGGSGKTTLTKVVFNKLDSNFEYTCFVPDVKLVEGNEGALKKEVWEHIYYNGEKVSEGTDWVQLQGKQLFLVLDDISSKPDVQVLLEIAGGSSMESHFIATFCERHLLLDKYQVPLLDGDHAQQLFMGYAFPNQVTPPGNLASLLGKIVKSCDRFPLTLEVLGHWLRERHNVEDWKQALHALRKAEAFTDFDEMLWKKLRLSYDRLKENEKQIFLDVTSTYKLLCLCHAKAAWRAAYGGSKNLLWQTLANRSLVKDVKDNEPIQVHEQLQSLGQKIVSESTYKWRVWEWPEALKLSRSRSESNKKDIHALRLVRDEGSSEDQRHVASPALQQLKNLQYLDVRGTVMIDGAPEDKCFPDNPVLLVCTGLQLFDPARHTRLVVLKLFASDVEYPSNSLAKRALTRS